MEAYRTNGSLRDLRQNLLVGLRLATGKPLDRDEFVVSIDQGLWLVLCLIVLELLFGYLTTDQPAVYSSYGLNYLGAVYLFDLLLLLLTARLAGAATGDAGYLLIAYLASTPIYVVAVDLLTLYSEKSTTHMLLAWGLWLLPIAWQLYILVRLLRILLGTRLGRSLALAGLNLLISTGSLWMLPYSELWYTDDSDNRLNPYAKLYELNVEDLFYDQRALLEQELAGLASQRPGVSDLYLVAVGGYGLEKVFLNEVEYVKSLFDRRFDTLGRSLILVNNVETVDRYPLANRHNLSDALATIGKRMDVDEDLLFLFMTSHGGKDHRFSLRFGPVPLNDLTPAQVRQALDDAGIRWRVIVVSSCYSGGFIEPLKEPHTLIITAAASDRKSFGCGAQSDFTDFGNAYFKQALAQQDDFIGAFDLASTWVADKEQREGRRASLPQRFVGEAIRQKLTRLGAQWENASPAYGETGPARNCGGVSARSACPP